MDVGLDYESSKPQRVEIYNLKDKKGQLLFKEATSQTSLFSECLEENIPLSQQVDKWIATLNSFIRQSFKKIRVRKNNNKKIKASEKINERNHEAKNYKDTKLLDDKIAEILAKEQRDKVLEHFQHLEGDSDGINRNGMWKVIRKLWPKEEQTIPVAKFNHMGQLVSAPSDYEEMNE